MNLIKVFEGLDKSRPKRSNTEIVAFLLMATLFILFIPLTIELATAKTILNNGAVFYVPGEFGLSTMAILASSWVYSYARRFKEEDKYRYLKYALGVMLLLGAVFMCMQLLGWQRIFHDVKGHNVKILMVLVAVHGFHFLIAIGLLTSLLIKVANIKTAADHYIYFLTPKHNLFFITSGRYWDFLGFLWMGLYIIMLLKTV
ncbi:MAG TPA: hypothetical protein VD794_13480 [Flavisolibacter sp.]|nr:hypothetical protein [Flavisolibacter sp.]